MAQKTMGYRCPGSGTCYRHGDDRLVGYGNPPSSPEMQRANPGQGTFPMERAMIPLEELPEDQKAKVPESLIFGEPDENQGEDNA